jgi:Fe2+ transport system protein FeoA
VTLLSLAPTGEPLAIVDVRAGERLRRRLAELELVPGTVVEVVQSLGRGPVIVAVGNVQLVLGRRAYHKVLVEPTADER